MKKVGNSDAIFILFLSAALLLCSLATVFSTRDIQHSNYLERAKSFDLAMSKIADHLSIAFKAKWEMARSLSIRIERLDAASAEDLTEELNDIYMETGETFIVIDDEGIAYYHDGKQEHWKDNRAVPPKSETFILSPLQFGVTSENYMKYIVPLKNPLSVGDIKVMYTVLTQPLSVMHRNFDTSNYGEGCLSFIIDKQGTYIYENGSNDRMADSYNFIAYLEKMVSFKYDETFDQFKYDIKNDVNKTVLVEYNGRNYYMSHFNLPVENWVSIMLVPEENTQADGISFTQKVLVDIAFVFVTASFLFAVCFAYMWKKTITKQRLAAAAERRSNEAKTNFLSSMSHDIRTPMNAIIGLTEIALKNREDIPKTMQDNLEKIYLSSTHMLMLINDILDISKIESGRMTLNIAEFSAVDTTNRLANLIRPLAKEKNIELRMHTYNYRQEWLLGDELRFSQVCINLATNAIKYTPSGGRVDIDFKQAIRLDQPNKVNMTCTVRDNGIGMSKEYQKVMYESFSRATDSRVNKVPGSGLGLAICRSMVQMMDGTLDCESAPEQGTTFSATVVMEKGRPDEVFKLPEMRVLVIDRDTVSTDALERIFDRLKVDFDIINDPTELPDTLKQNKSYRVAFVELGAPYNSGLDTVRMLRKQFGDNFPIILTDILDMMEYSEQIEAAGVKRTMNKPYFYRTVYQTIFDALGEKSTDDAVQTEKNEQSVMGMNVLVAEDNDLNWEIICELLSINGINAVRAENGKACVDTLEAAQPNQFDAVLMDVRMPVMDGHSATRIIRKSEKNWIKTIPVIAMTADAFAEDIHQCLESGMDTHLAKPINLNMLLSVLSDIKKSKEGN